MSQPQISMTISLVLVLAEPPSRDSHRDSQQGLDDAAQ